MSLARKNLFQDRRRAALSIVGVGAALVLVLVLDGVFNGAMRQATAYMRNSPADVFVSQRDVRTMHMSTSVLPATAIDQALKVPDVAWAEGLWYTTTIVEAGDQRRLTYVLGYDTTTGRAGPRRLATGHAPRQGQIVVDETAADELGVAVGGKVSVLGTSFVISGLSTDGTNMVNTTVYVRREDFVRLRGPSVAYILAGARPGVTAPDLARRLATATPTATVQTRAEFTRQEGLIVRDMAADIMQIMTIIGFLIALAVVGLTLFAATLNKLREYGVVKALGAGQGRLAATVVSQAAWTVALGLIFAIVTSFALGRAIGALTPNVEVAIEATSMLRTGIGALIVGAIAAIIPLRRVARVDPATAFRRP